MAGIKGRSGRKSKGYEARYYVLERISLNRAVAIMHQKASDIQDPTERVSHINLQNQIMLKVIEKGLPQRLAVSDPDGNPLPNMPTLQVVFVESKKPPVIEQSQQPGIPECRFVNSLPSSNP